MSHSPYEGGRSAVLRLPIFYLEVELTIRLAQEAGISIHYLV
jgi:hypothetical protein